MGLKIGGLLVYLVICQKRLAINDHSGRQQCPNNHLFPKPQIIIGLSENKIPNKSQRWSSCSPFKQPFWRIPHERRGVINWIYIYIVIFPNYNIASKFRNNPFEDKINFACKASSNRALCPFPHSAQYSASECVAGHHWNHSDFIRFWWTHASLM